MRRLMAGLLRVDQEGGEGSYLGLPECFSGSKQKLLNFINEKLSKRLNKWFAKMRSLGGNMVPLSQLLCFANVCDVMF